MVFNTKDREEYLKTCLKSIPNEEFEIKEVFGYDSTSGNKKCIIN